MNNGGEAGIGFVCAHGDAFELLKLAEEILDQVPSFVEFGIERQRSCAPRMLRNDDLGAAFVQFSNDGIAVEGLVGDQSVKGETVNEWRNTDRIETMSGQQNKAHEITERVG